MREPSSSLTAAKQSRYTLFESENKRQKIEPVPIPLPRASRNFPDVKTRNDFFFHNWTSEIIPFIRFGMQMDGTQNFFLRCQKLHFLQLSNFAILSYGHFPTRNGLKLRIQTIWLLKRAKRFFQKCQNNLETLDNFRPFLVGKWP